MTFGGQNAEAYWSADGSRLIFQSDEGTLPCDQIFTMQADGSQRRRVSNGEGKTTCSYFFPDGERIVYASTYRAGAACPPRPDRSRGYVWALDDYDIYGARADGSGARPLFASPGYDAEATISPDGSTIVFTSSRDGDLEIYTMKADGSGVRRLTNAPGYDGGPFFSDDGKKIVYRADHPKTAEGLALFRENLARPRLRPARPRDPGDERRRIQRPRRDRPTARPISRRSSCPAAGRSSSPPTSGTRRGASSSST